MSDKPTDRPSEGQQAAPCQPHSPAGKLWHEWFDRVGEHATVDVVNATANLVIAERDLATRTVSDAAEARPTLRAWAVECRDSALSVARQFTGRGKRDYEVRATCWQSLIDEIDRRAATRQASTGRVWDEAIRIAKEVEAVSGRFAASDMRKRIIAALRAARNLDEANNYSDET